MSIGLAACLRSRRRVSRAAAAALLRLTGSHLGTVFSVGHPRSGAVTVVTQCIKKEGNSTCIKIHSRLCLWTYSANKNAGCVTACTAGLIETEAYLLRQMCARDRQLENAAETPVFLFYVEIQLQMNTNVAL